MMQFICCYRGHLIRTVIACIYLAALAACAGSGPVQSPSAGVGSPVFLEFEGRPFAIVAADLKGSGNKDVVVAVKYTGLHVFYQQDGVLDLSSPQKLKSLSGVLLDHPLDMDTADFNNDGLADLAYATEVGVQVLINSGDGINYDGSLVLPSPKLSFNLKAIDLNKDNVPDIVSGGTIDDVIYIHLSKAPLNYELRRLKVQSVNELTPFSMQRPFTAIDLLGDGYPSLLIPEFQNSALWLIENRQGNEFIPHAIYVSDFNHKINYALPLHVDETKAYIAVAAGTFNPVVEIISLDKQSKTIAVMQRIPLPAFRDPVHIAKISGGSDSNWRLLVTSLEGLTIVDAGVSSYAIKQTFPIRSWLNTTAVMSLYYPGYIFTAVQKKDGVFVIPYDNK